MPIFNSGFPSLGRHKHKKNVQKSYVACYLKKKFFFNRLKSLFLSLNKTLFFKERVKFLERNFSDAENLNKELNKELRETKLKLDAVTARLVTLTS